MVLESGSEGLIFVQSKQQGGGRVPGEFGGRSGSWRNLAVLTVLLALTFSVPLYELGRFSAASELYSYMFLIPFLSGSLVWLQRGRLPSYSGPSRGPALVLAAGGLGAMAAYGLARAAGGLWAEEDALALRMTALLLLFAGGCGWFLGRATVRALAVPLGLLIFLVPLPLFLLGGVQTLLQQGSALAADGFFRLCGADFSREGLLFHLPTITLRIAPECSGIHSSLVLFISSVVAGHLFLRSPWRQALLVLAVLPLALLRNGFRVFVLGELCTHVGPQMIDSPLHHRGGPLFFALSLIPFFLLLFFLRKSERSLTASPAP